MEAPMDNVIEVVFPPADSIPGPVAVSTVAVFTGRGRLMGFSADGGAAQGSFAIFDGGDATGQLVGTYNVAANGSPVMWFGPGGIRLRRGAAVQVTAALAGLVLYVAGDWRPGRG